MKTDSSIRTSNAVYLNTELQLQLVWYWEARTRIADNSHGEFETELKIVTNINNLNLRLAAYYHNGQGDSGFICGGSLISAKLVITAAHCIHYKMDPIVRKAEEASFYIGKHNLESLNAEKNYIVSGVTQFVIHPDWDSNDDRYDADIAIAVLFRTVPFNKFVKPICLWLGSPSYNDLIGRNGVVAGWGKTEFDAVSTNQPKWTEIPVVNELQCIRSNDAFNKLTSERTFCAGSRDGKSGPCSGDSGKLLKSKSLISN